MNKKRKNCLIGSRVCVCIFEKCRFYMIPKNKRPKGFDK